MHPIGSVSLKNTDHCNSLYNNLYLVPSNYCELAIWVAFIRVALIIWARHSWSGLIPHMSEVSCLVVSGLTSLGWLNWDGSSLLHMASHPPTGLFTGWWLSRFPRNCVEAFKASRGLGLEFAHHHFYCVLLPKANTRSNQIQREANYGLPLDDRNTAQLKLTMC